MTFMPQYAPYTSGEFLCPPTIYAPSGLTTESTTSATFAAVSSANINTGAFTAPASGSVLVTAAFVCNQATANSIIGFALAAHGTVTPIVADVWQPTLANTAVNGVTEVPFLVTGLTAGTSYNFDLLFATATAGDQLNISIQGVSATTLGSNKAGPVIMTVQGI
jgi:hypothetical protein